MKTKPLKMRILFILLFFVFTGFSNVFAQSQTTYEKKVLEIKVKYLSIFYFGYEKELTLPEKHQIESLIKDKSEEQEAAVLTNLVMNYAMTHSESEMDNLLKRFENEMKNAEKLKKNVDLKREKEKKYEYTDRGSIQKSIKSSFLKWSQKGEFEKQADYEVRLQNQSQSKFTEICIEEIRKKINSFHSSDLSVNLLTYDAENEFFPTVFKFKGREWKNQVRISIDKAQNFKENEWRNFQWRKEESSWCFIYNDMFPSKIYLGSNSFDTTFKLPLSNQEEITVAFDDLEIETPHLKGFVFNYSTAMEKEKENNIYSPDEIEVIESVPVAVIESVPVYPGCENLRTNEERKDCTSEKIDAFVRKNFNSKLANDLGLSGTQRIAVQFKIDTRGNVVEVLARASHPRLEYEAKRVAERLPRMTPGKLRGKAVNVMYSIPIIFHVEN